MKHLIFNISQKNYDEANSIISESIGNIVERKMCEMKKKVAAKQLTELPHDVRMKRLRMDVLESEDVEDEENEKEDNEDKENDKEDLHEAPRVMLVKARIRGGKVQRRKKVSNVPGMTMRGGALQRMSASERRRRKLGAIRAARKSKSKKTQMLRKRKLSLMKRQRLGI